MSRGDKKLEKKKRERKSFTFFCFHLTLLTSCVENIKSSKNKTFVNLYTHTYPVMKRNGLEDRGKQRKKKRDLELSTLLARKNLLNLIEVILLYCLLISMHVP